MQIISNTALLSINETLIVQLISFLIFLYVINRVMIRPLRKLMKDRIEHVQNMKQDIVSAERRYEDILEEIRQRNAVLRQEAFAINKKLEEDGTQEAAELISATREEISVLKAQAVREVDVQILEAKKYIQKESETLSIAIMEKVLDRRLAR